MSDDFEGFLGITVNKHVSIEYQNNTAKLGMSSRYVRVIIVLISVIIMFLEREQMLRMIMSAITLYDICEQIKLKFSSIFLGPFDQNTYIWRHYTRSHWRYS